MQFDLEDFETAFWIVLLFVLIDIAITVFDVPLKRWRGADLAPRTTWQVPVPSSIGVSGATFSRFSKPQG